MADEFMTFLEKTDPKGAKEIKGIIERYEVQCKKEGKQTLYEKTFTCRAPLRTCEECNKKFRNSKGNSDSFCNKCFKDHKGKYMTVSHSSPSTAERPKAVNTIERSPSVSMPCQGPAKGKDGAVLSQQPLNASSNSTEQQDIHYHHAASNPMPAACVQAKMW